MLTPQTKVKNLSKQIRLETELYLKREDLHPFESHKGRSIPIMVEHYQKNGWKDFVISSSGNAALAAIYACTEKNINLKIFVGKNIEEKKLHRLEKLTNSLNNISVEQVDRPKQASFKLDKDGKAKFLRQSTDKTALQGYYPLAKELSEIKNLSAIFVPTSSGTTAQGLYEGFKKLELAPQIHIVQTTFCHPFTENTMEEERSLANAIVDKVAHRKTKIEEVLKDSQGDAWIATNQEIANTIQLVEKTEDIKISANSALSIVGLQQALKQNIKFSGPVVCLVTGQ